jgi:hypothetical protein
MSERNDIFLRVVAFELYSRPVSARALRAELNIWSREAAGTEVELVIPASIAYPREQTIAT